MAESRRKFDQDFKEGAVRLVRETGRPIAQIAKDLGINAGTLAHWVAHGGGPWRRCSSRIGAPMARPRITADVRELRWTVSQNTVAALMHEQGLAARRRRGRRSTTRPSRGRWRAPDLVKGHFAAEGINQKWYGDGTEIPTGEGRLHLASVLDMGSRRIVVGGVVLHTDGGSEYTAGLVRAACARVGIRQSMGRPGSALDNAVIESWHSTVEFELRSCEEFAIKTAARQRVAAWMDEYNRTRRHSSIGMISPINYELATRPIPRPRTPTPRRPEHMPTPSTTTTEAATPPLTLPCAPRRIRGPHLQPQGRLTRSLPRRPTAALDPGDLDGPPLARTSGRPSACPTRARRTRPNELQDHHNRVAKVSGDCRSPS